MRNTPASPLPTPSVSKPAAIPPHVEADRGRSSLDIPRRASPWDASNESQKKGRSQLSRTPERPFSRTTEAGATRQRPVSMGPWSPPRTPPTVTVQSPQDSPDLKKIKFPNLQPSPAAPAKALERSKSPIPPPVPPSRLTNRSPSNEKALQLSSAPASEAEKNTSQQTLPIGVSKPSPVPPPVNRADKPQVALKKSPPVVPTGPTSLEPARPLLKDKTSPFSTPPSSDESSLVEETVSNGSGETQARRAPSFSQGYFPPPPTHRSIKIRQENPTHTQRQRQDPRANGNVSTSYDPVRQLDPRPGLPKRNTFDIASGEAKNTSITQTKPVPSRTSTDLQRQAPPPAPSPYITSRVTVEPRPPPKRSSPPKDHDTTSRSVPPPPKSVLAAQPGAPADRSGRFVVEDRLRRTDSDGSGMIDSPLENDLVSISEFPDASRANRRPPRPQGGISHVETKYETRLFDISGNHVCSTGFLTRAWDINSGRVILDMSHGERETKITAIAFKPGATSEEEGVRVWLGSNHGDIQEVDLESGETVYTKQSAHSRREIVKIYRHQNSMWSLDDEGKLHVWPPDDKGLPNLRHLPLSQRVSKGHTFSIVIKDQLWLASGKDIRIYKPGAGEDPAFHITHLPLNHPGAGEVTSGAVISNQLDRVYFGHTDGKVTIYSTVNYSFLGVVNVSVYKINSLAGAGDYLWAGYNTGMIYVYDTTTQPWDVKKDWQAHDNPVSAILVDRSSVWRLGRLQVASIGLDNAIRMWDGLLADDWLGMRSSSVTMAYAVLTRLRN